MSHLTTSQQEELVGIISGYAQDTYPIKITNSTRLTEDMGYDSIDRFFLWEDLEIWLESFGRPREELIPESEIASWDTVGNVINSVESRLP